MEQLQAVLVLGRPDRGLQPEQRDGTKIIPIPHLLSVLATGTWSGPVTGLNQLQAQYQKKYGPGNYIPNVAIQYWSMRTMAYLGTLVLLLALWGGWLLSEASCSRPGCSCGSRSGR